MTDTQTAFVLVPREFLDFVRSAPVASGVCCCGGDMAGHGSPDHAPIDQWDYSLSKWIEQIEAAPEPPQIDPSTRFSRWVNEGPALAKAAGAYVGIKVYASEEHARKVGDIS